MNAPLPARIPPAPLADRVACARRADAAYLAPASIDALVRDVFRDLGLDAARADAPEWNPLGDLIRPGQRVLIKPNLVLDRHPRGGDLFALVTHGAVVQAVLAFALRALEGKGAITIGDSPLQTTDFQRAVEATGLAAVVQAAQRTTEVPIRLTDFRKVVSLRDERGHIAAWQEAPGDPAGYVTFDLGADSALAPLEADRARFRVSNYAAEDTRQYHGAASHRYVVAGSVLDADVILNLPKLKTHCKVGVTLGLKNFVGTVGRKQCLAHHREGGAAEGGDEYPGRSRLKHRSERLEGLIDGAPAGARREALKILYRANERVIRLLGLDPVRDGGWHGNDTCWRMTLDLVRIARFGRRDGSLANEPQRAILTILDGVVAGEHEGPLEATPRGIGALIGGLNPVQVDRVASRFMGFDPDRIPLLRAAVQPARWPLVGATPPQVLWRGQPIPEAEVARCRPGPPFAAPSGWIGHMELPDGGS